MRWLFGWFRRRREARDRAYVLRFRETFPGRCMICSHHQYGYTHGYEANPKPEPHYCIESRHA